MFRVRIAALAGLLALVAGSPVLAQDKKEKLRALNVDLGFVNASGNTSVTTLNLGDKFVASTQDKRVIFNPGVQTWFGVKRTESRTRRTTGLSSGSIMGSAATSICTG